MTPKTMQAIKIVEPGKAEIQNVPVPDLRDNYILVKVKSVALNPTDWSITPKSIHSIRLTMIRKHIAFEPLAVPGVTVGCDFSGTVVALGSKCSKDYKPGDLIAGVTHGSNASQLQDGCFGEYCMVKEGTTMKVPERLSAEEASTVGVAVVTVALGLYQKLELPYPGAKQAGEKEWMMVYGGSTATGSLAIQCAVL